MIGLVPFQFISTQQNIKSFQHHKIICKLSYVEKDFTSSWIAEFWTLNTPIPPLQGKHLLVSSTIYKGKTGIWPIVLFIACNIYYMAISVVSLEISTHFLFITHRTISLDYKHGQCRHHPNYCHLKCHSKAGPWPICHLVYSYPIMKWQ